MLGYRTLVTAGLVVLVFARGALTHAPAQATTGQAEPQPAVFTLTSDAAIITFLIKPDKTADFEMVLGKLNEALRRSHNARRHEQAAGWTVLKSGEMAQGYAVYVMRVDPVLKGEEYDLTRLIAEVFPVEGPELLLKYQDAVAGRGVLTMNR